MSYIVVPSALIPDVFLVKFVNSVIGQVHVLIVEILLGWLLIIHSRKPGQALIIYINPQRIATSHQHIDPKVKLQLVNQIRIVNISLHHTLRPQQLLLILLKQIDPFPLTPLRWLVNIAVILLSMLVKILLKLWGLPR